MSVMSSLLGSISEATGPLQASFSVDFVGFIDNPQAGHTIYEIEVTSPNGSRWAIHKRYSEVRELHETLRLWLGDKLPPIPGRRLFGNHEPAFIIERQMGLQRYLNGTLQLIASQMPSLLGFVGQFLCYEEQSRASGRGRSFGAGRQGLGRQAECSAPPASQGNSRRFECSPNPRAASLESCAAGPAGYKPQWGFDSFDGMPVPATLSRSFTPHSLPRNSTETPDGVRRPRRWSRQGGSAPRGSTSCEAASLEARAHVVDQSAKVGQHPPLAACQLPLGAALPHANPPEDRKTSLEARALVVEKTAEDVQRPLAASQLPSDATLPHANSSEDTRDHAVCSQIESGEVLLQHNQSVVDEKIEKLLDGDRCPAEMTQDSLEPCRHASPSPARCGASWEWPLSRIEKKERVRLIDQHVTGIERKELIGELEHLRSGRDDSLSRTEIPIKDRHST